MDTGFVFDMQVALNPTTASLACVEQLSPNSERAVGVNDITDKVDTLDVNLAEEATAGEDILVPRETQAKRKRYACDCGGSSDAVRGYASYSGASLLFAKAGTKHGGQVYQPLSLPKDSLISSDTPEKAFTQRARSGLADLRGLNPGSLCVDLSAVKIVQRRSKF